MSHSQGGKVGKAFAHPLQLTHPLMGAIFGGLNTTPPKPYPFLQFGLGFRKINNLIEFRLGCRAT